MATASKMNLCSAVLVASSKFGHDWRTRAAVLIALAADVGDLLTIKSFKREDRDQRTQRKTTESSVPYADATTAHANFFHWHPGAR